MANKTGQASNQNVLKEQKSIAITKIKFLAKPLNYQKDKKKVDKSKQLFSSIDWYPQSQLYLAQIDDE